MAAAAGKGDVFDTVDLSFEFSHTKSSKITGTFQAAAVYGSLLEVMTVGGASVGGVVIAHDNRGTRRPILKSPCYHDFFGAG